jgi:hypothetical protein
MRKTDVVVFIHTPTRKLALELVERFSRVIVDDLSYRLVCSSDDVPDNLSDEQRVGGRAAHEDKVIAK